MLNAFQPKTPSLEDFRNGVRLAAEIIRRLNADVIGSF